MMLKRYNIDDLKDWDIDDFREAMKKIVKNDNDEMFSQYLSNKTNHTGSTLVSKTPIHEKKNYISSVSLEKIEPQILVHDRTSP